MSYYPDPNSHIKDEFKVVLKLSNQATKTELSADASNLAAKFFYCFKN